MHKLAPFARRHWFVGLILSSVLAHAVLLVILQPWARTEMAFDRDAEIERTRLVQQRELARQELERQRRQELKLPRDEAEKLRRREELKRLPTLRENVRELARAREKVMQERERAFAKIEQRTEKDLLPDQLERLREEMVQAVHGGHQATREAKYKDEADRMQADLEKGLETAKGMKRQAQQSPDDPPAYRKQAAELAEMLERHSKRYEEMQKESSGSMESRAGHAKRETRGAAKAARQIAEGLDVEAMNDTSGVEDIPQPPAVSAEAEAADLYDAAVELERQIDEADRQTQAAQRAVLQGSTLDEAMKAMDETTPERPDLAAALRGEEAPSPAQPGGEGASSASTSDPDPDPDDATPTGDLPARAGDAAAPTTVGDLNKVRTALAAATSETGSMARRADRIANGRAAPTDAAARAAGDMTGQGMQSLARTGQRDGEVINLVPLQMAHHFPGGGNFGDSANRGLRADMSGMGWDMAPGKTGQTLRVNRSRVTANALPGRMLTDDSARAGYLYLDTWYIIGPWNNWSRSDFEITHPPEQGINLDATYEGKDGRTLRWEFVQSDRIEIQPPDLTYSATYYAYTEVYSDTTREMLVAVASDDMAKVWLNGQVIWEDRGQSSWNLDEGFRRVLFTRGFNTVLVRLENGPSHAAFSVLLCPPTMLEKESTD